MKTIYAFWIRSAAQGSAPVWIQSLPNRAPLDSLAAKINDVLPGACAFVQEFECLEEGSWRPTTVPIF